MWASIYSPDKAMVMTEQRNSSTQLHLCEPVVMWFTCLQEHGSTSVNQGLCGLHAYRSTDDSNAAASPESQHGWGHTKTAPLELRAWLAGSTQWRLSACPATAHCFYSLGEGLCKSYSFQEFPGPPSFLYFPSLMTFLEEGIARQLAR